MVQPSGYQPTQQYPQQPTAQYQAQPQAPPGPYYGPPPVPPMPKKSSTGIVVALVGVVAVVLIIVLIGAGALISGNAPAQQVTLTGVNWTINYNGATSGYFGPSPQSLCSACPLTFRAGERFTYTLQLQSSASFLTHSVDSVSIAFPFTLISTSPSLPISVSPGGTARVTFTIEVPSQGGSYVMSATINTT